MILIQLFHLFSQHCEPETFSYLSFNTTSFYLDCRLTGTRLLVYLLQFVSYGVSHKEDILSIQYI